MASPVDLRLAELDGRPRHPRAVRVEARRRALDRRRRGQGRLGGGRRDDGPDRLDPPGGPQAARRDQGLAARWGSSRCGRATTSATSRRRSSARSRSTGSRSSAPWSATGSAAKCTRTRRSRTSARPAGGRAGGGHGAGDRADGQRRRAAGADGRRRLGRLLPGRSLAAHFEFTVAVTADGPRILTPWHEARTAVARRWSCLPGRWRMEADTSARGRLTAFMRRRWRDARGAPAS